MLRKVNVKTASSPPLHTHRLAVHNVMSVNRNIQVHAAASLLVRLANYWMSTACEQVWRNAGHYLCFLCQYLHEVLYDVFTPKPVDCVWTPI